jgi:prepilin signal peptidase PulO-like enzyme (type II secretory pathway)
MLGQAIWWGSILLETLLLFRGFRGQLLARYPVFYSYIGFVWLQSLLRFSIYHSRPQLYLPVYWITQALGVLVGCAVVFEIYRTGLRAYPGTARMARNLLAFVFVMALTKALVDSWNDPQWWSIATNADLEKALRTVQSLAILALVLLFLFYSIPFGRNLRGILMGYGLFVAVSVIQLNFVTHTASRFNDFWSYVSPGSYFAVLGVWAAYLWSYRANPEPKKSVELEVQYQRLAAATSHRLREARGYLAKAVRP